MPMWRCPHCGTPQAETARCWVCRRSSTACLTCRHFRSSVAAKLGYCGLDRHRLPLTGDEIRSCWEAGAMPSSPSIGAAGTPALPVPDEPRRPSVAPPPGPPSRQREFVEVGAHGTGTRSDAPGPAAVVAAVVTAVADVTAPGATNLVESADIAVVVPLVARAGEARWSLWDDPAP